MKHTINLLPWREKRTKQRIKTASSQFAILILLSSFGYFYCFEQTALFKQQISIQQNIQAQMHTEQQTVSQQIQRLKQQIVLSDTVWLAPPDFLALLACLSVLPLGKGELTYLHLDNEVLTVRGQVEKQQEFEQVHQYFLAQPLFTNVVLAEMKSELEHIVFEIALTIKKAQ
ncbi:competence protein ComB [Pasteurella multocida]|uniref:competence protein ComB n=1 Tax=Pasteurella multocida TaxID=747 RepID=UPI002B469263|nr:competence protein ComB [Pasteurella multocida]MEB3476224.1 competence protein ComB [Pasteurella multocida]MEB3507820.1 competence protein ComB [Pasteurella multocida]WRJ98898.1 competence protein ComB [Pasteurella multocida]